LSRSTNQNSESQPMAVSASLAVIARHTVRWASMYDPMHRRVRISYDHPV